MRTLKAQSAMEYLMTYGWAILIIAVVLGALFSLGVFSTASLVGTTCVASSGYLCSNPILHGGYFNVTIGQATGTGWYSAIVCFAPANSTASFSSMSAPSGNTISFSSIQLSTTTTTTTIPPQLSTVSCPSGTIAGFAAPQAIASGQQVSASFNGLPSTVGATTSGAIWAVYQTTSSSPVYATQIAVVTLKAV
ncbi:MAG: hypothetical protein ACP5K9_00800 [Candidatus Micrarchaeia archaeon]